MIDKLIDSALKYRILVLVAFLAIILFGIKSYRDIPVDAFPDITPKQVIIFTESPGNSAEDIEKLITYPIESSLSGMAGVKTIMSNSVFGLSYVSVFFEDDMDIYFLRQLVNERLDSVNIPQGWGKPVLGPNTTGLGQVFWYQIHDKTGRFSLSELRQLQEYVVSPLYKSVGGVEEVVGWGGHEKQYDVLIDMHKLQSFGITYTDVVNALEKSNTAAGGQYLEFNQEQYLIRGVGLYNSLDDIRNTPIKPLNGESITINDVAEVKEGTSPRFGAVSLDGHEAVMGMVLQRAGTNAAEIVKQLKVKTATVNGALPEGVSIEAIYDRTEITHKAVNTMTSALLSGVVLVVIVLFLFLFELRSAFIVIISLPLSLLIAFLLMDYYELSANLMSLSGLAIAVGMIVDGTIVIVENSFRKLHDEPDAPRLQVIGDAAKEVATPVTYAVLIIAAVFIPLLSLGGLAGKLYTPMALNIVFVMLGSLLVALVLVPVLSFLLLKPSKSSENSLMKKIKKIYTPMLVFTLSHAKKLLVSISLIFVALAFVLTLQGREFMPELKEESIMYRVISIPGTGLEQSTQTAGAIEKHILQSYPNDVESVLTMIGRSEKGETAQANYMEVLLTLKPDIEDLEALTHRINKDLKENFEYVQFIPTQPIAMRIEELLEGVKAELAVKIYGDDQKVLDTIANSIQSKLKNVEGLEQMEIETQLGQSQIKIVPNYLALARYGISIDEVMGVIRNGIGEEPATYMIEGVRRFGIVPKIKDAKKDIESVKAVTIRSKSGALVSLDQICDISIKQGASFIKRENLSRYMVLSMEVEGRDIASFVAEADRIIKDQVEMPAGYYIGWAGDFKNMKEATQKLMIIIPITILLVILLLYTAFNSLSKAMLILMNVPFGFIGGIIALLVSGIYLSVSAIIGFLAIFAIAILNGIVLVSFIDELREKFPRVGLKILLKDATLLRLRPVLMTAFTTLFGILPLLFATGVGSEIQYPLAVVITGGIISSTLLTLLILPSTYLLFYRNEHFCEEDTVDESRQKSTLK
ncbi:MAG TPA: CusA/CzcA family heavy metal efflux RND transporter [Sulfuricurvum sp.]|nr:MAG: CusA/CzcA family heavy metal efflux RND transporter [Campylobacterales bacterium 16-40-21]OZA02138.1 MAG: CusA/CzcA family heavy metal efflux RND transporter [Sulfuricurvum sp. 17-40-25]HQS67698.1 CusA/CzcA family heavy metal efflux RND transporter [Sulfuricurvum sp.]HQT36921.1 CusA/CzcA family heavy metal efflux RND transporter [Sulfuricurvum sp.]